jgi:hypothetical protein
MCRLADTVDRREKIFTMWNSMVLSLPPTMIMEGDFNCILTNIGCTENTNFIKALEKVVRGFGLVDVWGTVRS